MDQSTAINWFSLFFNAQTARAVMDAVPIFLVIFVPSVLVLLARKKLRL